MNVKLSHPRLYVELVELFFTHDPMSLVSLGVPPDEYSSEVEMTMARVDQVKDVSTLANILCDVFTEMFDQNTAGTPSVYSGLAFEMYAVLRSAHVVK